MKASAARLVRQHTYSLTGGVVIAMAAYFAAKQRWGPGFDIWEHTAAVGAFMRNPLHPPHPFLVVDAPHPFLTPFHLALALVARVLFVAPTTVMVVAAVGNIALLVVALKLFVDRLVGRHGVAVLVLVFTLFLWGDDPWFFSGLLHSGVIWYVASYPSTFAIGMMLIALTLFLRYKDSGDTADMIFVALIGAAVLLTHQAEALFLYAAMGSLALMGRSRVGRWRLIGAIAAAAGVSLTIALAWPFFSLRDLVFDPGLRDYREAMSSGNLELYQHVLRHIWLALLGVPFLAARLRRDPRDPVVTLAVVAFVLYLAGAVFEQRLLGRLIAMVVLFLHIALADAIVEAAESARAIGTGGAPVRRWLWVSVAAIVLFGANLVRQGTAQAIPLATTLLPSSFVTDDPTPEPLADLRFLAHDLSHRDVVLADALTGFAVPGASGARIVATVRLFPWVADRGQRGADVAHFFDPATPDTDRSVILDRYRVTHVLVRESLARDDPRLYAFVLAHGHVVHRDHRFVLVRRS